jgi:ABC-type transport system involved in multi-copper enzyme maturation permease subunit
VRVPHRHNVSVTFMLLAFGVITAIVLAGSVIVATATAAVTSGTGAFGVGWVSFAGALIVWAIAGVGSGQRLSRVLTERTGRPVDGLPTLLLFVALALGLGASFGTASL